MKLIRRWWWIVPVVLIVAVVGFVVWAETTNPPMQDALDALKSDDAVTVTTDGPLTFAPKAATLGLVFYPGGRVDYRAYAGELHAIASQGYLGVIPPMPLNLAVFSPNAADAVIQAHPDIHCWAVGGHSLGGSMAAAYADSHRSAVKGLVLWASYPAGSNNLSASGLSVLSIFGTKDALASDDKIDAAKPLLPADTEYIAIQGGNHGQFGSYGLQPGDGTPEISREEQQSQVVGATVAFLGKLASTCAA